MLPFPTSKPTSATSSSDIPETAPDQPPGGPAAVALFLLRGYKLLISPFFFAGACRFYPSCADYMTEAIRLHGAARGIYLGLRRLSRCHPCGGHGFDPVVPPSQVRQ